MLGILLLSLLGSRVTSPMHKKGEPLVLKVEGEIRVRQAHHESVEGLWPLILSLPKGERRASLSVILCAAKGLRPPTPACRPGCSDN